MNEVEIILDCGFMNQKVLMLPMEVVLSPQEVVYSVNQGGCVTSLARMGQLFVAWRTVMI